MAARAIRASTVSRILILGLYITLCFPPSSLAVTNSALDARLSAKAQPHFPTLTPIPVTIPAAPESEADAFTFASHAAVPADPSTEDLTEEELAALRGEPGMATWHPEVDVPAGSMVPDNVEPPLSRPLRKASANKGEPSGADAKPAECPSSWKWNNANNNAVCRIYMYGDTAGTTYAMYTGWFADPTHVVTTGAAVATGGSGKYNLFAVNKRYGTVCCKPAAGGGPDSCPAGFSYNITRVVTTIGWLNKKQISNSGAVLKVIGAQQQTSTVAYMLADPFCMNSTIINEFTWPVYQYPSNTTTGCSSAKDGIQLFQGTSTGATSDLLSCNPNPSSTAPVDLAKPAWTLKGSACEGALGAPGLDAPTSKRGWGILTTSATSCTDNSYSKTGFSAVSNGSTSWGVGLASLIAALP
jgi:hypothetical protein